MGNERQIDVFDYIIAGLQKEDVNVIDDDDVKLLMLVWEEFLMMREEKCQGWRDRQEGRLDGEAQAIQQRQQPQQQLFYCRGQGMTAELSELS